jgi:hypothetical protein
MLLCMISTLTACPYICTCLFLRIYHLLCFYLCGTKISMCNGTGHQRSIIKRSKGESHLLLPTFRSALLILYFETSVFSPSLSSSPALFLPDPSCRYQRRSLDIIAFCPSHQTDFPSRLFVRHLTDQYSPETAAQLQLPLVMFP